MLSKSPKRWKQLKKNSLFYALFPVNHISLQTKYFSYREKRIIAQQLSLFFLTGEKKEAVSFPFISFFPVFLQVKYFSSAENLDFIVVKKGGNTSPSSYGNKKGNRRKPCPCKRLTALDFLQFYRDFRMRLFALFTTEVSKEAR